MNCSVKDAERFLSDVPNVKYVSMNEQTCVSVIRGTDPDSFLTMDLGFETIRGESFAFSDLSLKKVLKTYTEKPYHVNATIIFNSCGKDCAS